jgi:hypothetical protein
MAKPEVITTFICGVRGSVTEGSVDSLKIIARRRAQEAVNEMVKGNVYVEDFGLRIIETAIHRALRDAAEVNK